MSNTNFHNVDSEPGLPCHDKTFFLFPVNTIEIFNIISSLENKSTAGHDGISNKLLKLVASVVSYHVAKLINRSIREGFFPVCLKTAKIIPLHKMEILKALQIINQSVFCQPQAKCLKTS